MKLNSFLLAMLGLPWLLTAQKISDNFITTPSKPYQVVDARTKEYVSAEDGTAYMVKKDGEVVYLQKFSYDQMKEVSNKKYEDFQEKSSFVDLVKLKNNLYYIYSVTNKDKSVSLFSRAIAQETGTFEKPVKLHSTSRKVVSANLGSMGAMFMLSDGNFGVHKSFDETKLLITYRLSPLSRKDSENFDEIGFCVFDSNMSPISAKEIKLPYTEANVDNIAYTITNSGEGKALLLNKIKKEYEWLTVDASGQMEVEKLGLSGERLVQNIKMKESANGNIVCAGFYANGLDFKMSFSGSGRLSMNANGVLYFEVSKSGELLNNKVFDFSLDFIKQNLSENQREKAEDREKDGKAGISDLTLTGLEVKSDGSIIVLGEQQWVASEMYGPQTKLVYHFSNVIAVKISKDGNLDWMKKLPKNQAGLDGVGQMSFSYLSGPENDFMVYIDNPKNEKLEPTGGVPAAHKDGAGGFLTAYQINHETGKISKYTIADLMDIKGIKAYQFKAFRIFKAFDNTFLMEVYIKDKKDAMIKFELK